MTEKERINADQIKKAVAAVKRLRPAYKEMLDFYEKLFLAQEAAKEKIHIDPISISDDLLSMKRQEKFPLVNRADLVIDMKASESLLREICRLAAGATQALAEAGSKILDALDSKRLDPQVLFSKTSAEDDTYFEKLAKDLEIDKKLLAFVAYSSIKPSLSLSAEQLASYLDNDAQWGKGYCPVCGSPPALSILRDEGQRSLLCSFCGHEWPIQRIYCPFCENMDQKSLHYFYSEEEDNYRVNVCDKCKKYIKTVDTREMKYPVYLFLEQISTLHLDMLAKDQGLESGISLWL